MNGQFLGTRFCRLWTFKVTFYWGSGSRAGMVAAASGRAHSEGAFPTPPLLPPHSQPLDKPDGFGQQRPPSRSSSPQHPPRPPAGPLLCPSVPGTLEGSLWRPNGRRKMTRPERLRTPSPNSVTWQPQRGAQCIPPRRPRAASPRALGDETSPAHYRRRRGLGAGRGRGAAAATRAHLFSGRRVEAEGEGRGRVSPGYVRRGAQPPRCVPALPQPC